MSFEAGIEPVFDFLSDSFFVEGGKMKNIPDFQGEDDYIFEIIERNFLSLKDFLEWISWMWEGGIEVLTLKLTVLASGVVVVKLILKHRSKWKPVEH